VELQAQLPIVGAEGGEVELRAVEGSPHCDLGVVSAEGVLR